MEQQISFESIETKDKREYDIIQRFLNFSSRHDVSTEFISTDSKRGNIEVINLKKTLFRIRCTDSNTGIHIPDRYAQFMAGTGFSNSTELVDSWKCYTFDGDQLNDKVYFSLFCLLVESMRSATDGSVGCCSLYRQCSDLKRCVIDTTHPLLAETKQKCTYRINLLQGKIFYGVNALKDLDEGERELLKAYRYADQEKKDIIKGLLAAENTTELKRQIQQLHDEGVTTKDASAILQSNKGD